MLDRQINQQNLIDSSAIEIPPARNRVYAFEDLRPEAQQNLLRLQTGDGDFLRIRYVAPYTSGVLLVYLSIGFILFFGDLLAFSDGFKIGAFDLKWTIVFAGGALIFALCYLYLIWGFIRGKRLPVKKGIYLTPTQLIETFDGTVRYRELKDASEIIMDKFQGGWSTSLMIKFPDGDLYKYNTYMNNYGALPAVQIAEAEKWQEKAGLWRDQAISAAERGDPAYFDSLDVIQKSATAHLPVLYKYFPIRLLKSIISVITFALFALTLIILLVINISRG